jgi:hypothetical protein
VANDVNSFSRYDSCWEATSLVSVWKNFIHETTRWQAK